MCLAQLNRQAEFLCDFKEVDDEIKTVIGALLVALQVDLPWSIFRIVKHHVEQACRSLTLVFTRMSHENRLAKTSSSEIIMQNNYLRNLVTLARIFSKWFKTIVEFGSDITPMYVLIFLICLIEYNFCLFFILKNVFFLPLVEIIF